MDELAGKENKIGENNVFLQELQPLKKVSQTDEGAKEEYKINERNVFLQGRSDTVRFVSFNAMKLFLKLNKNIRNNSCQLIAFLKCD